MTSEITDQQAGAPIQDGPRPTQAERKALTRARLFRACLEVVADRGYQRASLAAIGQRAGYSRGVVNSTFGSKSALLGELVEAMYENWTRTTFGPMSDDSSTADALCAAIDAVGERARRAPVETRAFYLLLFEALGPLPELQPRFAALHESIRGQIALRIRDGITAGNVRDDVDPDAQAALIVGAIRGAMYQWLLDPERVELDHLLGELRNNTRRILEQAETRSAR